MNNALAFDFSVNKENKTITVQREFAAPLPIVWDAYTNKDILDLWWAPKPWKARTKTMDFKAGGHWLYAMVGPEGEEHWARADYKKIAMEKSYTLVDAFTDAEGNINEAMPRSTWEVTFTGKGDVTLVHIQISFNDLAQLEAIIAMGFKEGLTIAADGLEELLPSLIKKQ